MPRTARVFYQAEGAFAITKSDANNMNTQSGGKCDYATLYIGGLGDVVVDLLNGETNVTFSQVPAGTFMPVLVTKVKAATTATNIVGMYSKHE